MALEPTAPRLNPSHSVTNLRGHEAPKENDQNSARTAEHRKALLANQVCSLIEHERIKTTSKAKAVVRSRKNGTLGRPAAPCAPDRACGLRQKNAVKKLFDNIAPRSAARKGGYTRIIRLG
jgi:large subunit ribosomal protein L17